MVFKARKMSVVFVFILGLVMFCNQGNLISQPNDHYGRENKAVAIAIDCYSNIYVTGYSKSGLDEGTMDYATIKYNSDGIMQWIARYNGLGNKDDAADAIAVDRFGNVYVTGCSVGIGTGFDYATIKYDGNGVEQWVARYAGPGNSLDAPSDITVDSSGSVYVTGGSSKEKGAGYDCITIKYNTQGTEQWVVHNNATWAASIVVHSGNVYIVGSSEWEGRVIDCACTIIKYNSHGVEQWAKVCDNTEYNEQGWWKRIAMDRSENVYVTGSLWFGFPPSAGFFVTAKYDSSGSPQWLQRYHVLTTDSIYARVDEANDLAVDPSGNVYVTGQSYNAEGLSTYTTIKYSTAGVQLWAQQYHPLQSHTNNWPPDRANAIALDGLGNVYITGTSFGGWGASQYTTVKYDTSGIFRWVSRYQSSNTSIAPDVALAMATDSQGNIYVTGYCFGETGYEYATLKYNSLGRQQWVERYAGP